ncbi:ABC transporterauxiliary component-like protein [Burkholderia plantarii]|nr:ABC transporterauxiliary component-like protein [Burkholderia plantarii]
MQEFAMSRFTVVSARRAALAGAAFALALLAGCASDAARMSDIRYDLGPIDSGGFAAAPASGTVLKVLDMRAPDAFDTDKFVYRLAYADAQRIATYRDSRWTAPPAQLLTQRLRTALASRGTVLDGGDAVRATVLHVELNEFEQVFDGQDQSHGEVAVRATLTRDGAVLGQRSFVSRAPASTPDAAGGAAALAAASNELVAQLVAWLAVQASASP